MKPKQPTDELRDAFARMGKALEPTIIKVVEAAQEFEKLRKEKQLTGKINQINLKKITKKEHQKLRCSAYKYIIP